MRVSSLPCAGETSIDGRSAAALAFSAASRTLSRPTIVSLKYASTARQRRSLIASPFLPGDAGFREGRHAVVAGDGGLDDRDRERGAGALPRRMPRSRSG